MMNKAVINILYDGNDHSYCAGQFKSGIKSMQLISFWSFVDEANWEQREVMWHRWVRNSQVTPVDVLHM